MFQNTDIAQYNETRSVNYTLVIRTLILPCDCNLWQLLLVMKTESVLLLNGHSVSIYIPSVPVGLKPSYNFGSFLLA